MINKRILKTGVLAAVMASVFAIFAFRASEWTDSVSSEFLVYGASSSSGGSTTGGGGTTGGGATTKVVPQIAAGFYGDPTAATAAHYGTIIEIVNPNNSSITVSGNFYNEDGSASTLTYATNVSSQPTFTGSFSNINLPANSILVLSVGTGASTATAPMSGSTNWGMITGSNTISVATFFELRHRGDEVLYSRVGVPSSRPDMTSFVIPRVREVGTGLETGFAIVNTGTKAATITAKLIDVNGNTIATAGFPLAPNAHKVVVVNDPKVFTFLNTEATGRQYHYILFSSDQPTIGAAALAFEGGSLTSFPVDPLS